MRKSYDSSFMFDDASKLVGINLGSDSCAEHEWGIKSMQYKFGIGQHVLPGIGRRQATEVPTHYRTHTNRNEMIIEFQASPWNWEETPIKGFLSTKDKIGLACAWDDGGFKIHAKGEANASNLRQISEAIKTKNIAIWLGGGGVFQNAGLVLAIVSNIPADKLEIMKAGDIDKDNLTLAVQATGIEAKLTQAGKRFFALSPRMGLLNSRVNNPEPMVSKHPVCFFLNPMDQDSNNFGWFTVEDLEAWTRNEGPIPIKNKNKR